MKKMLREKSMAKAKHAFDFIDCFLFSVPVSRVRTRYLSKAALNGHPLDDRVMEAETAAVMVI
jgi:hypothetical protein